MTVGGQGGGYPFSCPLCYSKGGIEMNRLTGKGALLFVPAAIVFILFYYWPLLVNAVLSFFSWNMVSPKIKFVGISNYMTVIQSHEFYQVLGNTVLFIRSAVNNVPYAVGINNHMGSKMTSNLFGMQKVMQALERYNLPRQRNHR